MTSSAVTAQSGAIKYFPSLPLPFPPFPFRLQWLEQFRYKNRVFQRGARKLFPENGAELDRDGVGTISPLLFPFCPGFGGGGTERQKKFKMPRGRETEGRGLLKSYRIQRKEQPDREISSEKTLASIPLSLLFFWLPILDEKREEEEESTLIHLMPKKEGKKRRDRRRWARPSIVVGAFPFLPLNSSLLSLSLPFQLKGGSALSMLVSL